jgi:signal transduction histidine kinase/NADH:ubiquinone oxidoreductase subunit E
MASGVLVIGAEAALREVCARTLRQAGFEVLTTDRTGRGLTLVRDKAPEAVILALRAAQAGGEESRRLARELESLHIPLVVIGHGTLEDAVEAIHYGACDFLAQPFTPEALNRAVLKAVEHRELLTQTVALEKRKRLLEENFVSMASHELRAPLASLKFQLETLSGGLAGSLPDKTARLVDNASRKADALMRLVDRWLAMTRSDATAVRAPKPVDLGSLLAAVVSNVQEKVEARELHLSLDKPPEPVVVLGDAESLEELFTNLALNAVKYTPPGGQVRLRLERANQEAAVSVEDTGIGISEQDLGLVFEPFYRTRQGRTAEGHGLGLAIAKRIAESHGGRISVQSTLGQGTCFKVFLPTTTAAPAAMEAAPAGAQAADAKGDGKVGAVMVVGGGIGGMQAALDLAESGLKVYLVEKSPALGGVMAQLDKTFPTNDCAMCTLAPRMVECAEHPNIEKLVYSEVEELTGRPGRFQVRVRRKARSIISEKCTGCGECSAGCVVRQRVRLEPPEPEPPGLTPEELAEVDHIIAEQGTDPSAIVPILQDLNTRYNWLAPGALRRVSEAVGLPLARVLRIATFYNMFSLKPRGRYLIRVCMGTACHVKGAGRILDRLSHELGIQVGGTTADRRFTLEAVRCLGCCGLAPVATVQEDVYGKTSPAEFMRALAKYPAV